MGQRAIVLGAGLQGVSAAFALVRAGFSVTVLDRAADSMCGASLHNEGKIHLGLVYGNDVSGRTAALMLEAAEAFAPALDDWVGRPLPWADLVAAPFDYLILEDTLVSPDALVESWNALQSRAVGSGGRPSFRYLGERLERLWWLPESGDRTRPFVSGRAAAIVKTAERSVHTARLARIVRAAVRATDGVCCLFGHEVRSVQRTPSGFRVEATADGDAAWRREASVVVNCLWDGRLAIDREMNLLPKRPWVYRLKYRLLGRLPARLAKLPSLTMMLGRFGDVVNYGGGDAYLSWYPTCLRGWSSGVEVSAAWRRAFGDGVPVGDAAAIIGPTLDAFDRIVPGLGGFEVTSVAGGVIFSWGRTDIHDLGSELHSRADIGPEAHDGYITVNTGKFTCAPLFGRRIAAIAGGR
jgi:glycine/D-amino acid oxidase-like deaminating enzyme